MTDTTWIRAFNGKNVYTSGEMQAGTVRANSSLCIGNDCKTSWGQVGGQLLQTQVTCTSNGSGMGN